MCAVTNHSLKSYFKQQNTVCSLLTDLSDDVTWQLKCQECSVFEGFLYCCYHGVKL